MRATTIATGLITALLIGGTAPAIASDAGWEFCSLVYLKGGADPMCNYRTRAQCEAYISGLGGSCFENPNRKPAGKPLAKNSKRQ